MRQLENQDSGISLRLTDMAIRATPNNESTNRHVRFPHPGPLPEGEGDLERLRRVLS